MLTHQEENVSAKCTETLEWRWASHALISLTVVLFFKSSIVTVLLLIWIAGMYHTCTNWMHMRESDANYKLARATSSCDLLMYWRTRVKMGFPCFDNHQNVVLSISTLNSIVIICYDVCNGWALILREAIVACMRHYTECARILLILSTYWYHRGQWVTSECFDRINGYICHHCFSASKHVKPLYGIFLRWPTDTDCVCWVYEYACQGIGCKHVLTFPG